MELKIESDIKEKDRVDNEIKKIDEFIRKYNPYDIVNSDVSKDNFMIDLHVNFGMKDAEQEFEERF